MVHENGIHDDADEQMLRIDENEKLSQKREEVKFIKGGADQNGDAKIDIGSLNGKAFVGMTKEELMKYANDPFWVRLRWIFFVIFWLVWLAMLVGAILIIIQAPKCSAPEPLKWYKRNLLAKSKTFEAADADVITKLQAKGVVYELPAELTYAVKQADVENKIKALVAAAKKSNAEVILDITANYVPKSSQLMQEALTVATKRSAFIWLEKASVPNNWVSIVNGTAWDEVQPGNFVLSQFGDGLYDLHMNDTLVKQQLLGVFEHLLHLGVKGFRLKNTKFYLLTQKIEDEVPSKNPQFIHDQYGFWTHSQTTFQEGLGDLLYEYKLAVKNMSADAFFSVADDLIRPEVYRNRFGDYGVDLPLYGRFAQSLSEPSGKKLNEELKNTFSAVGSHTWLQWDLDSLSESSPVDASAYSLFLSLLPGVPVVSVNSPAAKKLTHAMFKHIGELRESSSYKYGDLQLQPIRHELVAYSRIKSGNPGYFVVFNPTNTTLVGNYTAAEFPEKMTVDAFSDNFKVADVAVKSKVSTNAITASPYATVVLTYVPVKSG